MSTPPNEVHLTDPLADTAVRLPVGANLVVRLTENPTTGYRWQIALVNADSAEIVSDDYQPDSARKGSGGQRSLTIRALRPGVTGITLNLRRKWESSPPAKSTRILLEVVPVGAEGGGTKGR